MRDPGEPFTIYCQEPVCPVWVQEGYTGLRAHYRVSHPDRPVQIPAMQRRAPEFAPGAPERRATIRHCQPGLFDEEP